VENGCRAPHWRQLHGDIAYIEIKLKGRDSIYVTASRNGYFLNEVGRFLLLQMFSILSLNCNSYDITSPFDSIRSIL
jgi:hypothetical protein